MALLFIGSAQAATGAAEQAGGGAFPPFDASSFPSQLFWLAITFGLTYYLMAKVALPRVQSIIEDRRGRIANDLKDAEAAQRSAEDAAKQFEANIAAAKANAQTIGAQARDAASKAADARRHDVESELSAKMVAAEKAIAETKAKAMTNVAGIAKDAASAIVERLSGVVPGDKSVADAIAALGRKEA